MFTEIIFWIIYFQIGLGNAIGCAMLKTHESWKGYSTICFILNLILWPLCVGLEISKKAGK